ncbi:MAG TPA: tetratricopeptide repeat protein [Acidobacteriota bacterium]|nr:tetratricopeptide repeat protein [Acidobacteriota bacterium]
MIIVKALPGILVFNTHSLKSISDRGSTALGILLFCLGFLVYAFARRSAYSFLPEMVSRQPGILGDFWNLDLIQTLLFLLLFYIPAIVVLSAVFSGCGAFFYFSRQEYAGHIAVLMPVWGMIALLTSPLQWVLPPFLVIGLNELSPTMLIRLLLVFIYTLWIIRHLNCLSVAHALAVLILSWPTLIMYYLLTSLDAVAFGVAAVLVLRLLWLWVCRLRDARAGRREFQQNARLAADNPRNSDALCRLGCLRLKQGNTDAAAGYFEKVLKIKPDDPAAHYYLGRVYESKGEWERALGHYEETGRIDHEYGRGNILREKGKGYLHTGNPGKAVEALERFMTERGDDLEGRYWLAKALGESGDGEKELCQLIMMLEKARPNPGSSGKQNREWAHRARKAIRDIRMRSMGC